MIYYLQLLSIFIVFYKNSFSFEWIYSKVRKKKEMELVSFFNCYLNYSTCPLTIKTTPEKISIYLFIFSASVTKVLGRDFLGFKEKIHMIRFRNELLLKYCWEKSRTFNENHLNNKSIFYLSIFFLFFSFILKKKLIVLYRVNFKMFEFFFTRLQSFISPKLAFYCVDTSLGLFTLLPSNAIVFLCN